VLNTWGSAWGSAWGDSWGNAWGIIRILGGDDAPPYRKHNYLVRYKGKNHIFDTDAEATAFLKKIESAQEVVAKPVKLPKVVKQPIKVAVKKIAEPEWDDESDIEDLLMLM